MAGALTDAAGDCAAAGAALLLPWALGTVYTLNHFYVHGAPLLDSGWFAALAGHAQGWALPNPPAITGGSFYAIHMAPIFAVLSFLRRAVWGGPDAAWFAVCQGAWYGLFSLAVWIAARPAGRLPALLAALLATLGGVGLATLGFPHFEIAIPALLALVLALTLAGRLWWALPLLPLLLAVREDAGLHAASLLGLTALYAAWRRQRAPAWRCAILAGICAAGSAVSLTVQHVWFAGGPDALAGVYLGDPPLGHLSVGFFRQRLFYLIRDRSYIYVPIALIALAAWRARDPLLVVGAASCLGWFLLALVARSHQAGTLYGYYAFPFLTALAWPALSLRLGGARGAVRLQMATGLLSVLLFIPSGGNHDRRPWRMFLPPSPGLIDRTEAALGAVLAQRSALGRLVVDDAVASWRAYDFGPAEVHPGATPDAGAADAVLALTGAACGDCASWAVYPLYGTGLTLWTRAPPVGGGGGG